MKEPIERQSSDGPGTHDSSRRLIVVAGGGLLIAAAGFAAIEAPLRTTSRTTNTMDIFRNPTSPTNRAPEGTFSGDVYIDGYFRREAPSRLAGATVTFTPGSRTPWKVNPAGQTLIVTSGVGWAQSEGEDIVEIRAGDRIWCAPGQRHWEGATPDQAMTYVAIQEEGEAGGVRFGETVTDEEYRKGSTAN